MQLTASTGSRASAERFGRSGVVGAIATGLDVGTLAVLVGVFGVPALAANPASLLLGACVQLAGTKLYVFHDRSRRWLAQGARFALVEALAFTANLLLFHVGTTLGHLPPLPLRLGVSALVYVLVSFPLWSRIFLDAQPQPEPAAKRVAPWLHSPLRTRGASLGSSPRKRSRSRVGTLFAPRPVMHPPQSMASPVSVGQRGSRP